MNMDRLKNEGMENAEHVLAVRHAFTIFDSEEACADFARFLQSYHPEDYEKGDQGGIYNKEAAVKFAYGPDSPEYAAVAAEVKDKGPKQDLIRELLKQFPDVAPQEMLRVMSVEIHNRERAFGESAIQETAAQVSSDDMPAIDQQPK